MLLIYADGVEAYASKYFLEFLSEIITDILDSKLSLCVLRQV